MITFDDWYRDPWLDFRCRNDLRGMLFDGKIDRETFDRLWDMADSHDKEILDLLNEIIKTLKSNDES